MCHARCSGARRLRGASEEHKAALCKQALQALCKRTLPATQCPAHYASPLLLRALFSEDIFSFADASNVCDRNSTQTRTFSSCPFREKNLTSLAVMTALQKWRSYWKNACVKAKCVVRFSLEASYEDSNLSSCVLSLHVSVTALLLTIPLIDFFLPFLASVHDCEREDRISLSPRMHYATGGQRCSSNVVVQSEKK